jgi:hypothetical protein
MSLNSNSLAIKKIGLTAAFWHILCICWIETKFFSPTARLCKERNEILSGAGHQKGQTCAGREEKAGKVSGT